MCTMFEPKKPALDAWLFRVFGIETTEYKKYWRNYCIWMQIQLSTSKDEIHKMIKSWQKERKR